MYGNHLKMAFRLALIIAILLYHLIAIIMNHFIPPVRDVWALMNFLQIISTIAIFSAILGWRLLIRLILRNNYIGGIYEGRSKLLNQTDEEWGTERFEITQNLFETRISGRSYYEDREVPASTWIGHLFKIEGNKYYFGIELSTDTREVGVLELMIENDNAYGFYYPGNPQSPHVFTLQAKRVKRSLLADAFSLSW